MGIGTSKGAYYDDEFHHATAMWDNKYDDNIINPETLSPRMGESPSPLTEDRNNIDPVVMQSQKNEIKDPNLIYDDQNNIIDYASPLIHQQSMKMPFPDNNNPDTDFVNRFPKNLKEGILNDLKRPTEKPLARKINLSEE